MVEVISLRKSAFSQKVKGYIETELKKNQKATMTGIIVDLLERGLSGERTDARQPTEEFFVPPPFLYCPAVGKWCLTKDIVGVKGCGDCLDKFKCPAWKSGFVAFELPRSKSRSYRDAHTVDYGVPFRG